MTLESIPFPTRPWDEVAPNLFVGGHIANNGHDCRPRDEFDVVVSLVNEGPAFEPDNGMVVYYEFDDADLDPIHHSHLDGLADMIARFTQNGFRVLVRCHGGINRSAMVAALAMRRMMGCSAEEAIEWIREARSPHCLFNGSFVAYIHQSAEVS